jgi:PRTRC genetic system protein A
MTKPVGYLVNENGLKGEPGVFYNFILAENGLFLKADKPHIGATMCIAPQLVRGLQPLKEEIRLPHGKIPMTLINLATSTLVATASLEKYLAIVWENGYSIKIPNQTQEPGRVTYETLPDTIMDIHSHTGTMPAEFSYIDDIDEQGLCVYGVVADLQKLFPTLTIRLGIFGYFFPIEKSDIFN